MHATMESGRKVRVLKTDTGKQVNWTVIDESVGTVLARGTHPKDTDHLFHRGGRSPWDAEMQGIVREALGLKTGSKSSGAKKTATKKSSSKKPAKKK